MKRFLVNIAYFFLGLIHPIAPIFVAKQVFLINNHYPLDLNNPKTYNEKLNWLKLYHKNDLMPICSDKFTVRQFLEDAGYGDMLFELLWEGEHPKDIPFDKLPDQFVLKTTHGSGYIIICKDKQSLDRSLTVKQLNGWLSKHYRKIYFEWQYDVIKPRIICEKYMVDESGYELKDYKVFCFHGKVKLIQVDFDRFTHHKRNYYDTQWRLKEIAIRYERDPQRVIEKPINLDKMIRIAEDLAKHFIHVRVDFYSIQERLYIGELTFFHESGYGKFSNEADALLMGTYIELPDKSSIDAG